MHRRPITGVACTQLALVSVAWAAAQPRVTRLRYPQLGVDRRYNRDHWAVSNR